jgi:uncharacterized protein
MDLPGPMIRDARLGAGLSQRALARRAGTSQPAIARYERNLAIPSWETLERLIGACGKRLRVSTEIVPDADDVELAARQLRLTPLQRLRALRRYTRLRALIQEKG